MSTIIVYIIEITRTFVQAGMIQLCGGTRTSGVHLNSMAKVELVVSVVRMVLAFVLGTALVILLVMSNGEG